MNQALNSSGEPRRAGLLRLTALVFVGTLVLGLLAGAIAAFVLPPAAPALPPVPTVAGRERGAS